jgi:hypothetical protein
MKRFITQWPEAVVAVGLSLSAGWTLLLVYLFLDLILDVI